MRENRTYGSERGTWAFLYWEPTPTSMDALVPKPPHALPHGLEDKRGRSGRITAGDTTTFFITATIVEWRPLLVQSGPRDILLQDLDFYRAKYNARILAYVIMPEHYHIVMELSKPSDLSGWLRDVQGHTAKEIAKWLMRTASSAELAVYARHANGDSKLAIWKEQARALGILSEHALRTKIEYIHKNPVTRGLVTEPGQWLWSSWRNYYLDDDSDFGLIGWRCYSRERGGSGGFGTRASRNNENTSLDQLNKAPYNVTAPDTYRGYTARAFRASKTPWEPITKSVGAGSTAIVYTDVYSKWALKKVKGKPRVKYWCVRPHVFILTNYDAKTQTFCANDTFLYKQRAKKDKKGHLIVPTDREHDPAIPRDVKQIGKDRNGNHIRLTTDMLGQHLHAQGAGQYFIYLPL